MGLFASFFLIHVFYVVANGQQLPNQDCVDLLWLTKQTTIKLFFLTQPE